MAERLSRKELYDLVWSEPMPTIGAAILLPWSLFFGRTDSGRLVEELVEEFEVSQDLIRYRIKICGAPHLYKLRNGCA